jgi:hypothetical protein
MDAEIFRRAASIQLRVGEISARGLGPFHQAIDEEIGETA